jgi:hypothetical protein
MAFPVIWMNAILEGSLSPERPSKNVCDIVGRSHLACLEIPLPDDNLAASQRSLQAFSKHITATHRTSLQRRVSLSLF